MSRREPAPAPARRRRPTSGSAAARATTPPPSTSGSPPPVISDDAHGQPPPVVDSIRPFDARGWTRGSSTCPSNSVALVVTSPPYFVGQGLREASTRRPQSRPPTSSTCEMLRDVFAECVDGCSSRAVASRSTWPTSAASRTGRLSADVIRILQDDLGLLLRGEIIWQQGRGRDRQLRLGIVPQRVQPGAARPHRARGRRRQGPVRPGHPGKTRAAAGPPVREHDQQRRVHGLATLDVWDIPPESATRVGHPAPFPVELPAAAHPALHLPRTTSCSTRSWARARTAVAAVSTHRHYVGFDLDPAYVDSAPPIGPAAAPTEPDAAGRHPTRRPPRGGSCRAVRPPADASRATTSRPGPSREGKHGQGDRRDRARAGRLRRSSAATQASAPASRSTSWPRDAARQPLVLRRRPARSPRQRPGWAAPHRHALEGAGQGVGAPRAPATRATGSCCCDHRPAAVEAAPGPRPSRAPCGPDGRLRRHRDALRRPVSGACATTPSTVPERCRRQLTRPVATDKTDSPSWPPPSASSTSPPGPGPLDLERPRRCPASTRRLEAGGAARDRGRARTHRDLLLRALDNGRAFRTQVPRWAPAPSTSSGWAAARSVWTSDIPRDLTVDGVWFIQAKYDSTCVLNTSPGVAGRRPAGRPQHSRPASRGSRRSPSTGCSATTTVRPRRSDADPDAPRRRPRPRPGRPRPPQGGHAVRPASSPTEDQAYAELCRAVSLETTLRWRHRLDASTQAAAHPDAVPDAAHRRRALLAARHQGHLAGAAGVSPTPARGASLRAAQLPGRSTPTPASPRSTGGPTITERATGARHVVEGSCELRWSHGKLQGNPECKVQVTTPLEQVPGYEPCDGR